MKEFNGIDPVILDNFDYWNYIQQSIGWANIGAPVLPNSPFPDQLKQTALRVDYLIDLHHFHNRRHGKAFQPMLF